jgi:hypothetical protein
VTGLENIGKMKIRTPTNQSMQRIGHKVAFRCCPMLAGNQNTVDPIMHMGCVEIAFLVYSRRSSFGTLTRR